MIRRALQITQLAMCGHLKARVELKRRRYCPPFLPRCSPCPFTFPSCPFFTAQSTSLIWACYSVMPSQTQHCKTVRFVHSRIYWWMILHNFFLSLSEASFRSKIYNLSQHESKEKRNERETKNKYDYCRYNVARNVSEYSIHGIRKSRKDFETCNRSSGPATRHPSRNNYR